MINKIQLQIGSLLVLITLFIILAINVLYGTLQDFNNDVYRQVTYFINPVLTTVMIVITCSGEWFIYAPLSLLLLIIPNLRVKIGIPAASVLIISAVSNFLLKVLFAIERPDSYRLISAKGYGFPSGHAMIGVSFIGICAYLFLKYAYSKPLKTAVLFISTVFILLVGLSRIYLGVHSSTDILGGYLAGLIILIASTSIIEKTNMGK